MTIATVGDLRRALEDLPDYATVAVTITVGGDIETDAVPLERLDLGLAAVAAVDQYRRQIDEDRT